MSRTEEICRQASAQYAHWDKVADMVDQLIDMMLNYRQSGHPGGSRSKVHAFVATLLGDVMRWDSRHPEKRFARPIRPRRGTHGPARLRDAARSERGATREAPANGRSALR